MGLCKKLQFVQEVLNAQSNVQAFSVSIINQLKLYYRFCLCLASVHLTEFLHLGVAILRFLWYRVLLTGGEAHERNAKNTIRQFL